MDDTFVYDLFSLKHSDQMPDMIHPHTHAMYEVNYFISGKLEVHQGFSSASAGKGNFALFSPGTIHNIYINEASTYERYVLFLTETAVPEELRVELLGSFTLNRFLFSDDNGILLQDLRTMERMLRSGAEHKRELMEQRICVLLSDIALLTETSGNKNIHGEIPPEKQAVFFQRDHLFEPIDVDDLAAMLDITPSRLNRLFYNRWKISVPEYIRISRLAYARMMIETGVPKTTAAFRVGYRDYSTYYRTWKAMESRYEEMKQKLLEIQASFSDGELKSLNGEDLEIKRKNTRFRSK